MLIIMLCHCTGEFAFRPFTPLGGIGVAIFLFLSGFGLNESYKKDGINHFWKKKLLRLLLPYALFRIVCVMISCNFEWKAFLLDIIGLQAAYWYIDYMVRCYLVFWIGNRFLGKFKWVLFAAFALYSFFTMDGLRAEQSLSFLFGIICSVNIDKVNAWSKKSLVFIMLATGLLGTICLGVKQLPAVREVIGTCYYFAVELGIKLPSAISMMIMLYLLPSKIRGGQIVTFCGVYSLELYLVHMYIVARVVDTSWMQAVAALLVSGVVAFGFASVVKKIRSVL